MLNSQLLYIVVLATVAGLILFRLYMVLGRRTGNERPREHLKTFGTQSAPAKENESPLLLPERSGAPADSGVQPDESAKALLDIKLADKGFETEAFLVGARRAYETIVVAFARGDTDTLRPLLSNEVYAAFSAVLSERHARREKVDFTFIGVGDVGITEASVMKGLASITVSFAAQFISATLDAEGAAVQGDPKAVRSVTDVWTFERNVRSSDPNWRLVATSGEADLQAT